MAGNDQRAGVRQAQALLGELECAGHGEGGRGQNDGIQFVEEPLRQKCGDIDGRGLQEAAAAATLDPINEVAVVGFENKLQAEHQLRGAADQRVDLIRLVLQELEMRLGKLKSRKQIGVVLCVIS